MSCCCAVEKSFFLTLDFVFKLRVFLFRKGGQDPNDANLVVVKFSVRKSGQYSIHVMVENAHVRGSPFLKTFLPGTIDPHKTLFLKQTSTVVCVTNQPHKLIIEPRDTYGNTCRNQDFALNLFKFSAEQVQERIYYFFQVVRP